MIITISREFGSGGREVGKRLADALNLSYYDSELITLIANDTGLSEQYINDISEKRVYPRPFTFARTFTAINNINMNQAKVLISEQKIIKQIADKGNCIIVGRGANTILKDYKTMDLFVYANLKSKINRCKKKAPKDENLTEQEMIKKIKDIDKSRKSLNEFISNMEWGKKENYDLCLNTSNLEIKTIIPSLVDYIENWFRGQK